jgi:phosphatidate phosphatase APP1
MAELYQAWAAKGAVFHYVSNSPWPLDEEMNLFLAREGFPKGLTHLRPLSAKTLLAEEIFAYTDSHKRTVLEELFAAFPRRRFILVGDSGERDPEIYGDAARAHPERVERILIRNATGESAAAPRFARSFEGLGDGVCAVFTLPGEIP